MKMQDNLKHIRQLPHPMLTDLSRLIVNRQGEHPGAFMRTRDILAGIQPRQTYQFVLQPSPMLVETSREEPVPNYIDQIRLPQHTVFCAHWCKSASASASDANILGGMGKLIYQGNGSI